MLMQMVVLGPPVHIYYTYFYLLDPQVGMR